jgi:hypothetical protein
MSLTTGQKIVRRNWDVIPMPDLVIARVNALGSDPPEQMTFTDRHGRLIGDSEITGVDSDEDDDAQIPGVDVAGSEISLPPIVVINDDLDIPKPTQLQLR